MNRRTFLGLLAGIPFLGFVKPETVKTVKPQAISKNVMIEFEDGTKIQAHQPLVKWSGAGDSWESNDGGQTWTQTGFAPSYTGEIELVEGEEIWLKWDGLEFEPAEPLTIKGNFLEEDIEQVRQRHYDHYRLTYNGESSSTSK